MELRNTPPKPAIEERGDAELIEDLCLALRDVACCWFPDSEVAKIAEVKRIHAELAKRSVALEARMKLLSEETSWRIEELLQDCLKYPDVIPYVREEDGVRRTLRCHLCRRGEFAIDRLGPWICDACVSAVIDSIESRVPIEGVVLFRTYNASKHCEHADADTVLMTLEDMNDYEFQLMENYCARCLTAEQERRKSLPSGR